MKKIQNCEFGGERPLFNSNNIILDNVTINVGESALKRCRGITAENCIFKGKYPFWHASDFKLTNCVFEPGARAALWYSKGCVMKDCRIDAPKMFRMMIDIDVRRTKFSDAQETFWDCSDIVLRDVSIDNCDYLMMHSRNIDIDNYVHHGNYSFQYVTDSVIRNAEIHSKDAFWNTQNVTIIDSSLTGEYFGWYSNNLTLINCHISGTQPLCYINNLTMINCTLDKDCDLAFEETIGCVEIESVVTSIKNPRHGVIKCNGINEIIIDKDVLPDSDCKILTR